MNVKMIRYIISKMMGAEGLLMLLPMMVGIIYGEHTSVYFLITAAILTAIYLLFGRKCPENMTIYAKEGLIIVATALCRAERDSIMPRPRGRRSGARQLRRSETASCREGRLRRR